MYTFGEAGMQLIWSFTAVAKKEMECFQHESSMNIINIILPLKISSAFCNGYLYSHPCKLPKFEAYSHRVSEVMDAQRLLPGTRVYSLMYKAVTTEYLYNTKLVTFNLP